MVWRTPHAPSSQDSMNQRLWARERSVGSGRERYRPLYTMAARHILSLVTDSFCIWAKTPAEPTPYGIVGDGIIDLFPTSVPSNAKLFLAFTQYAYSSLHAYYTLSSFQCFVLPLHDATRLVVKYTPMRRVRARFRVVIVRPTPARASMAIIGFFPDAE